AALLDTLLAGMREALGANLVGIYLRGSLALGDFEPDASDVDFFAITTRPMTDAEFAALAALHAALSASPNPYGAHLEGPYLDRAAAWRYQPGQRMAAIARTEALAWSEPGANWVIERWVVRERGVTLLGPDPRTLIAPISADDLRAAARARLPDWANFARQTDDPEWQAHRGHKAYCVETMCRALHTIATGEAQTKPQAVAWALANLPEPWRATVARSRAWHGDPTRDDSLNPEVQRFILWAASQAETR
ncbi:MAG: DUF4111 domain-containing protein, partial [Chloroflexota bacterium]|nr:DUF4111 domain-containing protein [Chloroflexota bacterium]